MCNSASKDIFLCIWVIIKIFLNFKDGSLVTMRNMRILKCAYKVKTETNKQQKTK